VTARPRALRVLVVDDDAGMRALLRTTLEAVDMVVDEAESAAAAARRLAVLDPDVVVLDVGLPGVDGLAYCRELKTSPATRGVRVALLTGTEEGTPEAASAAGADGFLRKPFSPLELLSLVERLGAGAEPGPFHVGRAEPQGEQLLAYARDLRRLLDVERGQRELLQRAYRETVTALVAALESKDSGTGRHSQRVQRYALALAEAAAPQLLDDPSVEFGFLLHDVGKIGIPDEILLKPGALTQREWEQMQTHTVLGEAMLSGVAHLQGEGLRVVRSHHERWDGSGYPDRLAGEQIPLAARIFALADSLDAITSDRPYRAAATWEDAVAEIAAAAGKHFDPHVVGAFRARERQLREIRDELTAA
jgi:ribonuclease P protein subunit RPR2